MQRFVPSIRRSAACATSARAAGAGSTPVVPGIYVGRLGTESSVFRVAHDDRGVTRVRPAVKKYEAETDRGGPPDAGRSTLNTSEAGSTVLNRRCAGHAPCTGAEPCFY